MFELVSEDRQRKSTVLQIIRKSVPSGRAGTSSETQDEDIECHRVTCRGQRTVVGSDIYG